ncbi:FAD-binding domain-containing protein [Polyplosphaeria fusca]|uniref:FAD-binding domain-containing protein n=1 Tax=Polyplosphaeria fusca TaxID=682080 RepID=A0A9P4QQD0_9PLEO|nr:FAD-binding domain-containing protein [Polyplosphaeria fusca]
MMILSSHPSAWVLAAGLQELILLAGSDAYAAREASYWAENASLSPYCIVQPRTTNEVALVVKALSETDGPIGLRSGGVTQWAGSNDVKNGVTIDLGKLRDVTYNAQSKLASLQPGARWDEVYGELQNQGVCVTGGRIGNVGVGGFLTGCGNSFHSAQNGFGCDNVVNFEVVLGNATIVNANSTSHPDLWTALKGGSGNFGIVTRFDMFTFPATEIWGGNRISVRSEGEKLAQALVDFTNNNNKNPEDAFVIDHIFDPSSSPDVIVLQVIVDTHGVINASAFDDVRKIPAVVDDVQKRTLQDLADNERVPSRQQQVWFSLSFKNDIRVINKGAELHDQLVEELKALIPSSNFATECLFQPLPTIFTEHSIEKGGNVMGLDKVKENALIWLIAGASGTPEESAIMREKLSALTASFEQYAASEGLGNDLEWLNYADQTQNPLKSYGKENVDFIRKVAEKYDPAGVFQKKVVTGWKISKVSQ